MFEDDVVSLISREHPAVRRGWDVAGWLEAEHIAPTPTHPGARGVIDDHLESMGLKRNITARCAHFGLMPAMVASSLLVLTTSSQFCARYVNALTPAGTPAGIDLSVLRILKCPVVFPRMHYYQLWHERTHTSSAARWLRERIKAVAAAL